MFDKVAPVLIHRVCHMEMVWQKESVEPKVSADFDLTLDTKSVLHAIQQLNFVQLKGMRDSFLHSFFVSLNKALSNFYDVSFS